MDITFLNDYVVLVVVGICLNILLTGMISGLSSTGFHQAFKNIIGGGK